MRKTRIAGAVFGAAAAVALMAGPAAADDPTTSGSGSVLGGNQVQIPVSVPINACGNAISVLGLAGASGQDCGAAVGSAG